jgi:hypothetical protein
MGTISVEDLCGELNSHRRRLYFLLAALDKFAPETAIQIAERMERFVTSKKAAIAEQADADDDDNDDDDAESDDVSVDFEDDSSRSEASATDGAAAGIPGADGSPKAIELRSTLVHACNGSAHPSNGVARSGSTASTSLAARKIALDPIQRAEFKKAIASGAGNETLATQFGLTRRQAHGLRIGFARAKGGGSPAKGADDHRPRQDAAAEREQQKNFLRQKPMPPPTLDDIVRFLRQIGDIVVKNGDHYLVNYSLSLTTQELVMRANRKRAVNGKPPFELNGAEPSLAAVHG